MKGYVKNKYLETVWILIGFTPEMPIAYFKYPTWSNKISGLEAGDAHSLFGLTCTSSPGDYFSSKHSPIKLGEFLRSVCHILADMNCTNAFLPMSYFTVSQCKTGQADLGYGGQTDQDLVKIEVETVVVQVKCIVAKRDVMDAILVTNVTFCVQT